MEKFYKTCQIKLHTAKKYYKEYGAWKFILLVFWKIRFIKKYNYQLIFFEMKVGESSALMQRADCIMDDDIYFYQASREDIENVEKYFDGWFTKKEALKRLDEGYILFLVKREDEIVIYEWLELKKVEMPFIELSFFVPDKVAYIAALYTVPEYRLKGFAARAILLVFKYLQEHGYQKVFIVIEPDNVPSIRLNKNIGFNEYQTVTYWRVLFLRYYRVVEYGMDQKKVFWRIWKTNQQLWNTFSKINLT